MTALRCFLVGVVAMSALPIWGQNALFVSSVTAPSAASTALFQIEQAVGLRTSPLTIAPPQSRAFARTGETQENQDSVAAWMDGLGRFAPPTSATGPTMVAADFAPVASGLVRHVRSAINLFRAPGATEASAVALSKSGVAADIRCYLDPTRLDAGDELPVRLYVRGSAVGGVTLKYWREGDPLASHVVADPSGFCRIPIAKRGVWRLVFDHTVVRDSERFTGSLTFIVDGGRS